MGVYKQKRVNRKKILSTGQCRAGVGMTTFARIQDWTRRQGHDEAKTMSTAQSMRDSFNTVDSMTNLTRYDKTALKSDIADEIYSAGVSGNAGAGLKGFLGLGGSFDKA